MLSAWRRTSLGGKQPPHSLQPHAEAEFELRIGVGGGDVAGHATQDWEAGFRQRLQLGTSVGQQIGPGAPRGHCGGGQSYLVGDELRHQIVEVIGGPRRVAVAEAGVDQQTQGRLDVQQPARSGWRNAGQQARGVAVGEQHLSVRVSHVGERPLPGHVKRDDWDLAGDVIREQDQEFVLACHVTVEGTLGNVELLGQAAHGQGVETLVVEQVQSRGDDGGAVEAPEAARRRGIRLESQRL